MTIAKCPQGVKEMWWRSQGQLAGIGPVFQAYGALHNPPLLKALPQFNSRAAGTTAAADVSNTTPFIWRRQPRDAAGRPGAGLSQWPRGLAGGPHRQAAQFGIQSIPTLLIFNDGQVVDQVIGAAAKEQLAARLDQALQAAPVPAT